MIKRITLCVRCGAQRPGNFSQWTRFSTSGVDRESEYNNHFSPEVCPTCWEEIEDDPGAILVVLQAKANDKHIQLCDGCSIEARPYSATENAKKERWADISFAIGDVLGGVHFCAPCWNRGLDDPPYVVGILIAAYQRAAKTLAEAKAKHAREPGLEVIRALGD